MLTMLMMMMTMNSWAGRLHDGFMGLQYGPDSVLVDAPSADCRARPENMVAWECKIKIGDTPTNVGFMAQSGVFFAVIVTTTGYSNSANLNSTLKAAYGKSHRDNQYDPSPLPKITWADGQASGTWTYNEFSNEGQFVALRTDLYSSVKAKSDELASEAAKGL